MKKAILFSDDASSVQRVYRESVAELKSRYDIGDKVYCKADFDKIDFSDVEYVFSTWGMPAVSEEEIKRYFPQVKALFYAAGSVQWFARQFINCNVKVFSAWQANAIPVIEYAVSQILLANKGYFQLAWRTKRSYDEARRFAACYKGNYGAKIGILGDGAIGSQVIERLREYKLQIYVYSITMSEERAERLGVKLASLKEIFTECDVISNHLANNEQTKGIICKELIDGLKDYSTFINTGRGAQVDESALIEKLTQNPTITAVLDVTFPEPPKEDSPLYLLPNVVLTPHIAGSSGNEVCRMAEYMLEEAKRFENGEKTRFEVTREMLETMA